MNASLKPVSVNEKISVLLTGSEVLDGRVQDTNANYIAKRFADVGLTLQNFLACDDQLGTIAECIDYLLGNARFLIISGGIGPTTDDLTREAVSEYTQKELVLDEEVLAALKARYEARKRVFDPTNTKQALFPKGALPIKNPVGTAAGFEFTFTHKDGNSRTLYILPGVPVELRRMFEDSVLPDIQAKSGIKDTLRKSPFVVFGVPESVVGQKVVATQLPDSVVVSYRAAFPEVHVILKSNDQKIPLDALAERAMDSIGKEWIVSREVSVGVVKAVHELLTKEKLTISVAESCTGGGLGSLLTDTSGSSAYFLGGMITYSNEAKIELLGVAPDTLKKHGAVSYECAKEMASQVRTRLKSDVALSITGIAGPQGGTPAHPVGTFYVGFASAKRVEAYRFFFSSDRTRTREYEAYTALDVLRRNILELPIREHEILVASP